MKRVHRPTKQSTVTTWVVTFICIGAIGADNSVHGQVVIDTDTVIDAGNSFPNSAIEVIDGDNPPTVVDIVQQQLALVNLAFGYWERVA